MSISPEIWPRASRWSEARDGLTGGSSQQILDIGNIFLMFSPIKAVNIDCNLERPLPVLPYTRKCPKQVAQVGAGYMPSSLESFELRLKGGLARQ
jgi:hypothetical protein